MLTIYASVFNKFLYCMGIAYREVTSASFMQLNIIIFFNLIVSYRNMKRVNTYANCIDFGCISKRYFIFI